LPELGRTEAALGERGRIFDGVVDFLRGAAQPAGCLVILDDLQWFDDASLALLHYASRTLGSAARVLFACAARGDELRESAGAIRCVRTMQREARLEEIELSPLDEACTLQLARAVGVGVDAAKVVAGSGGHPFFALELARAQVRGVRTSESLDALL